jgi:hypothetical protein
MAVSTPVCFAGCHTSTCTQLPAAGTLPAQAITCHVVSTVGRAPNYQGENNRLRPSNAFQHNSLEDTTTGALFAVCWQPRADGLLEGRITWRLQDVCQQLRWQLVLFDCHSHRVSVIHFWESMRLSSI